MAQVYVLTENDTIDVSDWNTLGWTGTAAGGGGAGHGGSTNTGAGGGAGEYGGGKLDVSADVTLTAVLGVSGAGGVQDGSKNGTDAADTTLAGDVSGNLLTLVGGGGGFYNSAGGTGGTGGNGDGRVAGGKGGNAYSGGASLGFGGGGYTPGNATGYVIELGGSRDINASEYAAWGAGGSGGGQAGDGSKGGAAKLIIWKID